MARPQTFKLVAPGDGGPEQSGAIRDWQKFLNRQMQQWNVDLRIKADGVYGLATRDLTWVVLYGLGVPKKQMERGVTPELRTKIRNMRLTDAELNRHRQRQKSWLPRFRKKHERLRVARPIARVTQDSWGWTPSSGANVGKTHDGIDLICGEDAPIFAICRAKVLRADPGGWWGKAPSGDVTKGDGVIILEALDDNDKIKKGMRLCYGHAEAPRVEVGQIVEAGQRIGKAGLAVVPHVHFMVHMRNDARGVGDRDPRPVYEQAMKNG